jgi:hypothetical protein
MSGYGVVLVAMPISGAKWRKSIPSEILLAAPAIGAHATGAGEPGNANALADAQPHDASPDCIDPPYDFVARNDGYRGIGEFAIHDVQIRAANAAGGHLDSKLARSGLPIGQLRPF